MKKFKCSIAWCPWKAKHEFTLGRNDVYDNYRECWFHYEEMPLINWAWDLITYPIKHFFYWIRFSIFGFPKGALLYWVDLKFLLTPRLHNDCEWVKK